MIGKAAADIPETNQKILEIGHSVEQCLAPKTVVIASGTNV
jgi:hypothetical protein